MKKSFTRSLVIWGTLVLSLIYVYPTIGWMTLSEEARRERLERWKKEDDELARQRPSTLARTWHRIKRWAEFDRDMVINLGLDLQGGIHMVIGFNWQDLPEDRIKDFRDQGYSDAQIAKQVQEIVLQQIRRRVHDFEAKEPIIQALGTNQVQIQLPGEKDLDRAKRLITKTAQLNFHIVAGMDETAEVFSKIRDAFPNDFLPYVEKPKLRGDHFRVRAENFERVRDVIRRAKESGVIPKGKTVLFSQPPKPYQPQEYQLYVVDEEPIMTGDGLRRAAAVPDRENPPFWQILFEFNNAAGEKFGEATEKNIERPMAIVLDNMVVSAPVIKARITTRGQITGNFEQEEATDLAIALNSGSMVVPVHEEFTRIVGASLGADSVRAGVRSAIVSTILVAGFMIVYYLTAGVVACIGLLLNGLLIIAAFAYFNMTLTLPGIAGLILTIGMAVDANVLIYERIREELRLGHSLLASIENGFDRAAVTILDANITTLIAAAVLFQFGTGPIEGFAIALAVGVCATVIVSLVHTRAIFDFLVQKGIIKDRLRMLALIPMDLKIPFMQWRVSVMTTTIAIIVFSMGYFFYRGSDNFGVDFLQGTNLHVRIVSDRLIEPGEIRVALTRAGFESPIVQETSENPESRGNEFIIRVADISAAANTASAASSEAQAQETPSGNEKTSESSGSQTVGQASATTESSNSPEVSAGSSTAPAVTPESQNSGNTPLNVGDRIRAALASLTSSGSINDVIITDEQTVGPAVGAQLRTDALKSIFWSFVFIILYLWFRFELKFAIGAVVATLHDVLITVGLFSLMGRRIDMTVIAALLTVIGYSLNDTIVVFDRIRENLRILRGKGYQYIDLMNMAINSTLSRTTLTALTTLFSVVVLYFLGGPAINDFALVLILGIVVGTYSSIFIASPVVYYWQRYQGKHILPTDTGTEAVGSRRKKVSAKPQQKPSDVAARS